MQPETKPERDRAAAAGEPDAVGHLGDRTDARIVVLVARDEQHLLLRAAQILTPSFDECLRTLAAVVGVDDIDQLRELTVRVTVKVRDLGAAAELHHHLRGGLDLHPAPVQRDGDDGRPCP